MLGGRPCISRTAVAALLSAQLLPCSLGVHHSPGFVSAVRHHSKAGQLGQNAVRITGTAGNILGWRRNGLAAHVSGGLRGGEESGSAVEKAGIFLSQALSFARAQILPLGLLWAIAFGLWQPAAGVSFGRFPAAGYAAHAIFFLGGLVLKTDEAKEAIMATKAVSFGVLSILLLTSVLGVLITGALPLPVREFSTGASLFVCMPCTIVSDAPLPCNANPPPNAWPDNASAARILDPPASDNCLPHSKAGRLSLSRPVETLPSRFSSPSFAARGASSQSPWCSTRSPT